MAELASQRASSAEIGSDQILSFLFSATAAASEPALVLVARPPGTIASPATGRLVIDYAGITVINGNELRALHPTSVHGSAEGVESAQAAAAEWVRASLAFARENRRSVLLDGQFSAAAAVALTRRYRDAGFHTRVILCGARRAESLLWSVSEHLRTLHSGARSRFAGTRAIDSERASGRALAHALEKSDSVDRVTVLDRAGQHVFDAARDGTELPFDGASAAMETVDTVRLTSLQAAQWLSELRRVTAFAATRRDIGRPVGEALIDLHEMALREIIPELPIPTGSTAAAGVERNIAADLVLLRRSLTVKRPVDATATVTGPVGPEPGGLSR